jgi:hypothetical protein
MEIAQRLKEISRQKAELDAEAEILELLPQELDVSSLFCLHGDWHLNVRGDLPRILELLPPLNAKMEKADGSWRAYPEDKPLDWNQRILALRANRRGVEWHYKMSFGPILQVRAENAVLPVPEGYEVELSGAHHVVAVRKLQPLPAFPVTPEDAWESAWDGFFEKEKYGAQQRMFANTLRVATSRNQEISMDMLPIPVGEEVLQVGDATLKVLRSGGDSGPAETVPATSPFYAFARIGRFWNAFTKEEAQRLVDFANTQRCYLVQCQEDFVKAGIAKAKAAIEKFQAEYMGSIANPPVASVLTRYVQEQTGYPVEVHICSDTPGIRNSRKEELWLHLCKWNERAWLVYPETYTATGFNFQNPAFYQYVPNNKGFSPAPALAE